jgi:hypothetical protein
LRRFKIDEAVCMTIAALLQTHPSPEKGLWEAGPDAVRLHVPDITEAEWTAACNRNFWPVYQAEMERQETTSGSRNPHCARFAED